MSKMQELKHVDQLNEVDETKHEIQQISWPQNSKLMSESLWFYTFYKIHFFQPFLVWGTFTVYFSCETKLDLRVSI